MYIQYQCLLGPAHALLISRLCSQVADTESRLTVWESGVTKLRAQHHWMLFFSVPKQLHLYRLIQQWEEENMEECVDMLVQEVMFLVPNNPTARQGLRENIEVSCTDTILSLYIWMYNIHVIGYCLQLTLNATLIRAIVSFNVLMISCVLLESG